ncbi:MAG TPA: hypothetical protein VN836_02760 [Verrucomicrobiae bacterium]|nr:hypothetical protein [Verrucomicrobiae bacterium]
MKTYLVVSCALGVALGALAGPNEAALRQARDVSARVTQADQGNPPATAPAPAVPPQTSPPPSPALAATLQNIANLRADFAALGNLTGTNAATQKQLLMNDLATAAQGPKPSPASVSRLADDLVSATAGKAKADATQQNLARDIHAIFNSSQLSPSQKQMIFDSTQNILQSSGAAAEDATNVVNDIKQIATETK